MIQLLFRSYEYNGKTYYNFYIGYGSDTHSYIWIRNGNSKDYKYLCDLVKTGVAIKFEDFIDKK